MTNLKRLNRVVRLIDTPGCADRNCGASHPVTPCLLAETYHASRAPVWSLPLQSVDKPWSDSLAVAIAQTEAAVERALRRVMMVTPGLRPDLDLSRLPVSRTRDHLQALLRL